MILKIASFFLLSVIALGATFDNVKVGDSAPINTKALLEVKSTAKGFLGPRMTTGQRDAITSPPTGLEIFNTTTNKKNVYNGTAWVDIGSADGAGVNFVGLDTAFAPNNTTDRNADVSVGNWATYDDGAVADPVDMTGGSASTLTLSRTTTAGEVLNGPGSFKIVKTAADSKGEGLSVLVNVPPGYRGQNNQIQLPVKLISGSLVSANLKIAAYDVTNAALLAVTNSAVETVVVGSQLIVANVFVPASTAQLRLGFHFSSTDATAGTFSFDDVSVGPPSNIGQVSQATIVGKIVLGDDCTWTKDNTAFPTDFSADGSCTISTAEAGNLTSVAGLPHATYLGAPAGKYEVTFNARSFCDQAADNTCECQIVDNSGTVLGAAGFYQNTTGGQQGFPINFSGTVEYTTAGDRTWKAQCRNTGAATIQVGATGDGSISSYLFVKRFPASSETVYKANQVANSWSGTHDNDCSFTTSDTSYNVFAADASCTFTQKTNLNFGTVSPFLSGSDDLPGIVFTPTRPGTYEIEALVSAELGTNSQAYGLRMTDGTTVIDEMERNTDGGEAGSFRRQTLKGHYTANNTNAVTIRLEGFATANTLEISGRSGGANAAIKWIIKQIDQSFPAPVLLLNNVISNNNGERIERATFTCHSSGSAVISQSGSWISVADGGGNGACTLTFTAGIFSATPSCTCSSNSGGRRYCGVSASSSTAGAAAHFVNDAEASGDINIICMGPK